MVKTCCVVGCKSRSSKESPIRFHRLPVGNAALLELWQKACGLPTFVDPGPLKNYRICSRHFVAEDYDGISLHHELLKNVIPSQFLPVCHKQPTHHIAVPIPVLSNSFTVIITPEITLQVSLNITEIAGTRTLFWAQNVHGPVTQGNSSSPLVVPKPTACDSSCKSEIRRLKAVNKSLRKKLNILKSSKSTSVKLKNSWRSLYKKTNSQKQVKVAVIQNQLKESKKKAKEMADTYDTALSKIFTKKQLQIVLQGRRQAKWTNEEIAKAISIRYKANSYEQLRSMGYPFPSTRTLQRWTQSINFEPGILYSVINLLKQHFEFPDPISRQVVISFDEMSLDSSLAYDFTEDRIYGPKSNMNVYFVRGLFTPFKQPFAYDFDEQFTPEKFLHMVGVLESAGLHVRANVNDLGGKNRGLWRKLGVFVEKDKKKKNDVAENYTVSNSIKNPTTDEKIYFFADTPHMIKLLRNHTVTHGITLKGGHKIEKSDFEYLLKIDAGEFKANFKVTNKHLNLQGSEKMRVAPAVQLFSKTTAEVWRIGLPNKSIQADFIELTNDFFDVMNSRNPKESQNKKKPFGLNLTWQLNILDKMQDAIINLRVGDNKFLLPFQRGILISIKSMRELFHDMSGSSMRISYILTHRLNQDIAENSFSMIRSVGRYNDNPTAVDAKRRLKLLMLSWSHLISKSASVTNDDSGPFLTGAIIRQLMEPDSEGRDEQIGRTDIEIGSLEEEEINLLTEDNYEEIMLTMGKGKRCEEAGHEYVAGFVASKFKTTHPELSAQIDEVQSHSWVKSLSNGGLTIPSLEWRNQCQILDSRFDYYHHVGGGASHINKDPGVLKGFCAALQKEHPKIPPKPLFKYIKTRLFIRIKKVNQDLIAKKAEVRAIRLRRWLAAKTPAPEVDSSAGESEVESDEDITEATVDPNRFEEHLREEFD